MWQLTRAAQLLIALGATAWVATIAPARALSQEEITTLSAELKSQQLQSREAALEKLSKLDRIPDELISDTLALDMSIGDESASPQLDPGKSPAEMQENLRTLVEGMALSQKFDPLWSKMDSPTLARSLRRYLQDPKERVDAIEIPSHSRELAKQLLPDLIAALSQTGQDDDTVYWECKSLENLGRDASSAVPVLLSKLSDPSEKVRESSIRALDKIGVTDKSAAPILIKGLHDEDPSVSFDCGNLLTKLHYDPAEQIQPLLDDLNGGFTFQAMDALEKIGPKVIGPVRDHAAKAPFEGIDNHISVLRSFKDKSSVAFLGDLQSTNVNLRYMAVDLVEEFPDAAHQGVDWLTPYLTDADKNIRVLALKEWIAKQPDASKRIALLQKDIPNSDFQATAIDLAGGQKTDAKPLIIEIQAAIEQTTDDKTKINYLADECDIDPADPSPYDKLTNYLHSSDVELVKAALDNLIYDDALRARSQALVQEIHDDKTTPDDVRREIDEERSAAKSAAENDIK